MNAERIRIDLDQIARVDPDVNQALKQYGYPQPRVRPEGFGTLLSIVIGQQISTEAAAAVIQRVETLLPEITASKLLKLAPGALRAAGLSRRKVEYAEGLALAIVEGRLDLQALAQQADPEAIESITSLRGFGPWSAEIYLMFSLQRADIFPAADLALQVALQRLKGLQQRPDSKLARETIQHWSPWRSAGSLFLWHYYRGAPT